VRNDSPYDRHTYDGRPFYCADCGVGWGEFMACEEPDCRLESEAEAQRRRREKQHRDEASPTSEDGTLNDQSKPKEHPADSSVQALQARIRGLEAALREIVENTRRVSVYGAADRFRESIRKAEALLTPGEPPALEQP
jgi:hypothetical protein